MNPNQAPLPIRKSTNGRKVTGPRMVPLLERVAPGLTRLVVTTLFFHPPRTRAPLGDDYGEAETGWLLHRGRRVRWWKWGAGQPVILVHGWGGHSGQMLPFVAPLRARGYSPVVFDAPAHGRSQGYQTHAGEFAEVIVLLSHRFGPIGGLVAHSIGGVAASVAMARGLAVDKAVFIGVPDQMLGAMERHMQRVGLSPGAVSSLREEIPGRVGLSWQDIDLRHTGSQVRTDLLVIHDDRDRAVPAQAAESIVEHWPGATRLTTLGLGHTRILGDDRVVEAAVNHLCGPAESDLNEGIAAGETLGFEAREWDRYFFERDAR